MASLSVTNSFTAGTTIVASEVNTNFTDVSTYINNRNGGSADWDFVSSAGLITGKDGVRSSDESATTPAYSFTSSTGTGSYLSASNQYSIATAGSQRMTIDSSGNTSFGIEAGDGFFHIHNGSAGSVTAGTGNDELVIENDQATVGMQFLSLNTSNVNIAFGDPDDAFAGAIQYQHTANLLRFFVGGADHTRLTSAGMELFIDGTEAAPGLHFDGDEDTGISHPGADIVAVSAGGVAGIRVDDTIAAASTRLIIFDVDNGVLERVTVGIADSGGAGFKLLRIPN